MTQKDKLPKLKLLLEILKDPDRKPVLAILKDLFSLCIYYRKFPRHYFSRYLFKKGRLNIKDYFPDDFLYHGIKPLLNDKECRDVLENKLFFHLYYGQYNLLLPKILMHNHKTTFILDGKSRHISNYEDFAILINELFEIAPASDSLIIKKTFWSYGGDKVFKISRSQVANRSQQLADLYSEVIKSGFLFQETVIQHDALSKLNPFSLNTIRFDTFMDKEGKVYIISGYMRMSINKHHVDNISSGGCKVGIDLMTGRLKKEGYSTLGYYGVKTLKSHPITETVFENFEIPYFDKAKRLVLEAAYLIPGLRIVGWDVAIGVSGPVLIEGNSDYGMSGNDLSEGGYRTNPIFRKILDEIKYL
jgi:hypothetical protein